MMEEIQKIIEKLEVEINKTPTSELRNLLCDINIIFHLQEQQALKHQQELLNWLAEEDYLDNYKYELVEVMEEFINRIVN